MSDKPEEFNLLTKVAALAAVLNEYNRVTDANFLVIKETLQRIVIALNEFDKRISLLEEPPRVIH